MEELEKIARQIEKETDFEKVVELFSRATEVVKTTAMGVSKHRGRLLEIVRDMDDFLEQELKFDGENPSA